MQTHAIDGYGQTFDSTTAASPAATGTARAGPRSQEVREKIACKLVRECLAAKHLDIQSVSSDMVSHFTPGQKVTGDLITINATTRLGPGAPLRRRLSPFKRFENSTYLVDVPADMGAPPMV